MNNLFRQSLPYAETHYKFKLPWSPLFKRWPEVFLDGPSICIPGAIPRFYLVVKDADYFPLTIKGIEIELQSTSGQSRQQALELEYRANENLVFIPLSIDLTGFTGTVTLNGRITVENAAGIRRTFLNANFPGLATSSLKIHLLTQSLPYPVNWHAGELHCHSDYSNDPVEFGAPLHVLQEAGQALGLGYVVCTDHSYDFYYQKTRYMEKTNPDQNFQAYRAEALALNQTAAPGMPVMIPGEEVSCGNSKGENVHLLVAGCDSFLPGLGDGGRRWLNNRPDLTIAQVVETLGDTPCFAAHPRVQVGNLERWIFRRGRWDEKDLETTGQARSVNGLQFWNGTRNRDYREGREFWITQLLKGRRLFPIGANDAHGDLNQNIGVKTPLFSLYQNRKHVFGNVRTVVHAEEQTPAAIKSGLGQGKLFCTDGPALTLCRKGGSAVVEARSIPDYGPLEKITLYSGQTNAGHEATVKEWRFTNMGPLSFSERVDYPTASAYIRVEAETSGHRFALTAPLFQE